MKPNFKSILDKHDELEDYDFFLRHKQYKPKWYDCVDEHIRSLIFFYIILPIAFTLSAIYIF